VRVLLFVINIKLLFLIKGVSTMADECKPVGREIGARSKRKAANRIRRRYSQC
jgi:hypothetical protein